MKSDVERLHGRPQLDRDGDARHHQDPEEKLDRHGYGSASEYVRELIRCDLTREAIEKVDALLLEGINSGPVVPVTKSWWKERHGHVRKAAVARTQRRRGA